MTEKPNFNQYAQPGSFSPEDEEDDEFIPEKEGDDVDDGEEENTSS